MLFELTDHFQVSLTEHIVLQWISQKNIFPPVPAFCFRLDIMMFQASSVRVKDLVISLFHLYYL